MNKCFYLSTKDSSKYYGLKDVATNSGISLCPAVSEIAVITGHYIEKCPILVDDLAYYHKMLGSLSSDFCEDVYLVENGNVYKGDAKIGTIEDFFKSEVFSKLATKKDRASCKEQITSYLKDYNADSDWAIAYIIDVLGEMYYLGIDTPTDKLLEFVYNKNRIKAQNQDDVDNKLQNILKDVENMHDVKQKSTKQLFNLLYNQIF